MTEKRYTTMWKPETTFSRFWIVRENWERKLNANDVVDLLNELHDENEQLKRSVQYWYAEHKRIVNNYVDKIKEVEKENEQLKQQNKGIQDKVWKLLELLEKEKGIDKRKIIDWWNGDVD